MHQAPPAAVTATDLVKVYGSGDTAVRALDGITVGFDRGRFTAIMGPSGSGKSTLMHCLAGLDTATSGRITISDVELTGLDDRALTAVRRDRIGFVFQAFNLLPQLTAGQNITLPGDLAGRAVDRDFFDLVVNVLGVRDRLKHRPSELSGGQQQRVALARALATRPDVVFADEPTGNLDTRSGAEVLGFLRHSVHHLGQTVVMVTHDPQRRRVRRPRADARRRPARRRPRPSHPGRRLRSPGVPGGCAVNTSVLRSQLSGMLRRPARVLLSGLSVLVAAFVVTGTVIAYDITKRTTLETFSATPRGVDLVVTMRGRVLLPQQVEAARTTPGVAAVNSRIDTLLALGTEASGAELTLSADPGSGPLSAVTTTSGTYPSRPRQIALHRLAAARLGAGLGSKLLVQTGQGVAPITVTVTGVVDGGLTGPAQAYAPDAVVAALTGDRDVDRLDIAVTPGTDTASLMTTLARRAGHESTPADVITGDQARLAEAKEAVNGFDTLFALIAMFIAIAVVAAGLVTTSTFRIVFAQRLRQLALLRAIGAQRGQLVSALAVEGAVVGLLTSTAGVLLAAAAGAAVPRVAAAFGRTLLAPQPPLAAGVMVVIGAGLLTIVAVLAPAFTAAGVAPLQALRSASTNASERGIGAARVVGGGVVTIAAAVLAWQTGHALRAHKPAEEVLLSLVGVGALTFGALIVFGPLLVRPILAGAGWLLRATGPVGRLAVAGVGGAPRRAAAVAVVVALGVTLVAGTLIGAASLRATVDQRNGADTPTDLMMTLPDASKVPDVVARLRADPHFRHVTPFTMGNVGSAGGLQHSAIALDLAALPTLAQLQTTDGTLTTPGPGQAVLSRHAAENLNARVGSVVSLDIGQKRTLNVRVTAVLTDIGPLHQHLVLADADLARAGGTTSGVLADAANGSLEASLTAFRPIAQRVDGQVAVLADARTQNDKLEAILLLAGLGLLGLTVLISVIGVGTTTGLSVLERTRETGLLRALGLNRRAVKAMIGIESGLYGIIGSVLGIALGVPFAWLALHALGGKVIFTVPVNWLLLLTTTMVAITMAAGLLPARKAAKVSPVAALAAD